MCEVKLRYFLHQDVKIVGTSGSIKLSLNNNIINLEILGSENVSITSSSYYPEFGKEVPNSVIVCQTNGSIPLKLTTRISW